MADIVSAGFDANGLKPQIIGGAIGVFGGSRAHAIDDPKRIRL
jgi:hypothetical protein